MSPAMFFFFGFTTGAIVMLIFAVAIHDDGPEGPMHKAWDWIKYR